MKKWIWTIIVVVIVALIGGYAYSSHRSMQSQYDTAMADGKSAIQDKKYSEAETDFQNALRHKSNDKTAQAYLNQTQSLVSAESNLQNGHFDVAKSDYNEAKNANNGSSVLVKRAKDGLKNLKTVQLKADTYQQIYDSALTQNRAQQYTASNSTLDRIFNDAEAKQAPYSTVYNKAVDLRSANNKAIKNGGDGTPSDKVTASNSSSSSASSSSASANSNSSSVTGLTDAEKKEAKNYKGKNEYTVGKDRKEINGKTITAKQIQEGRNLITASGLEEGSFSDQDIRDGLIAAHKAGMTYAQYLQKNYK
ncbi:hypothetical protein GPK34_06030 [Secundilactobacillus kimchicus]|uniref:Lipoprotein n=1 Tax=Secundilactobacillus kimchicus JCM 15530 TaxID=1302272 RepID=A0A0R1HM06_9LACO|nr:hypothetical protein [Secundilactobacillus kimchicus]KRK47822.1 lipoprotein [Secundilactobacillus kimchicus JCM 15530]MBT9671584.1 hypothetical protein [Secundilactobacillus kimchicus]